jgi:hypothetical protein
MQRRVWTDNLIETDLRAIVEQTGSFPAASTLRKMGRNDLCCAMTRHGGVIVWASRLGMKRGYSDSDFGWQGESAAQLLFQSQGITCEKLDGVKSPYDLLADHALRVDVKTAKFAEYGACRGWFYRIGKHIQADLIFLYQMDTNDFYGLPWWACPSTNITVARDGGKYAAYRNCWDLIRRLINSRKAEISMVA